MVTKEITAEEWFLIETIRNYRKAYPNGAKMLKTEIMELVAGFAIYRVDGVHCYGTNSFIDNFEQIKLKNSGSIEICIEKLQLIPNEYFIDVAFHNEYGVPYDDILKAERISVYSNIKDQGIFRMEHKFKHI